MLRAPLGVAALLVPVLVLGGGVAALAFTTEDFEQHRVANLAYDTARADAADAREDAVAALDDYLALAADSGDALDDAATLTAIGSDRLDATATAALTPLVERLTAALPEQAPQLVARPALVTTDDPETVTLAASELARWADTIHDQWAGHAAENAEIEAALAALRDGILAVAKSVASTGKGILDATGSASAESRTALTDAIAAVATAVDDGTDPADALTTYLDAAKAAQDSHAAAVAAAAAAGGSGGSGSSPRVLFSGYPFGVPTDPNNPPQVTYGGAYIGGGCPWNAVNAVSARLLNGEVYSYYSDAPYSLNLLDGGNAWYLVINTCVP